MTHLTSDYLNPKIEISWRTYEIWPQGACQISQILDSRKIIWKQDYSLDCETKTSGGASLRPRASEKDKCISFTIPRALRYLRRHQFPKTKSTNFHAASNKRIKFNTLQRLLV